ncbi:ABC transporter permease [Magnetospirillum fulvum]|uniref:Transport permease protein n=1 Tax=Magnetospirillum fulvum TaxID=1082 RepID=A0A1H6J1A0_MAGFU|nr:ABC transporter permease [Magnetospirillum fulvum]SEH52591.1 ABC-type multidrug transport system, permease component [Magnetospirillum fulvum]
MSPLSGAGPIFQREIQLYRAKLARPTFVVAALVTPLMYLVVFGLGLGRQVRIDGGDYLTFLVPGLMGMAAMHNAFTWVASGINIARFYHRTWQIIMLAPVSPLAVVAGTVAAGMARGLFAAILVGLVGLAAGWRPEPTAAIPLALLLETSLFSALGMVIGLKTRSTEEHTTYTNFLITPMGFFCGTFFPLASLPSWLSAPLHLLPLTHANIALRQSGLTGDALAALGILTLFAVLLLGWAGQMVARYRE